MEREIKQPAALSKAESLLKFAKESGEKLSTFSVTLTESEAYELLDYLAEGGMGRYENHQLLVDDVREAKITRNPWKVLACFHLDGLSIAPVKDLH